MSLKEYTAKRDFTKSKEPKGDVSKPSSKNLIFVVQKHDASRLHFDFRLEIEGVLKSWAVPKGPSFNPAEKRLAVETEDHPIEYATFEGTIPEGEYGGGVVMIWDEGTYENLSDKSLSDCLKDGLLEINLKGHRLEGGFALKRFRPVKDKNQWLLIKMKDDAADKRKNPVSVENRSVKSNMTMEEIEMRDKN